jgi:hypothetical protein
MSISLRENICTAGKLPRNEGILMTRAELLAQEDRDLIEAVILRGQSAESVGRMMNASPRAIRQRVHRLGRRLTSKRFMDVARAMPYLLPQDALLSKRYFCQGASYRRLSREFGMTDHALRKRLDRIAAQIQAIRRLMSKCPPQEATGEED